MKFRRLLNQLSQKHDVTSWNNNLIAIYAGGCTFSLVESQHITSLWHTATEEVWTPPGRRAYGGRRLNNVYAQMEARVDAILHEQSIFVFIESPNINNQCIINLSVVVHGIDLL